uniref:SLX9 ribosome biosis factor n=1 Tax=Meleagris gallopavo TaxID=9103 RepID=A0A803Y246_MELGA
MRWDSGTGPLRIVTALGSSMLDGGEDWDFSSSDIFSGLTIDPDSLVKKLDLDSRSIVSSKTGLEGKTLLSKKEKMKLRKERWLQKIESVKLAKRKQKAEAKRKATPVVGDMQPLMEALPELSDLTAGIKGRKPSKRYVSLSNGLSRYCLLGLFALFLHELLTMMQPGVLSFQTFRLLPKAVQALRAEIYCLARLSVHPAGLEYDFG